MVVSVSDISQGGGISFSWTWDLESSIEVKRVESTNTLALPQILGAPGAASARFYPETLVQYAIVLISTHILFHPSR